MTLSIRSACSIAVALCSIPFFTGCSLSHFSDVSSAPSALPAIQGSIHGGQQPVAGASVQLYAANILANKGASTAINTMAVVSDANGNFSITGKYVCPTPTSLIYIVATGGNPGLSPGTNNASLAMMTALGTCGTFLAGGNNISLIINELTTVAAIEALAPFMADSTHIGADSTSNPNALGAAFASANSVVSYTNGGFVPRASGGPVPNYALYNTLADIAAACINSAGNTGATSNCGKFQNATNVAADTIAALLYAQQHPANNVSTLFSLVGGTSSPFQPALTSQPNDFAAALTIPVPNTTGNYIFNAYLLAIDGAQNIWVADYQYFADTKVFVYDNTGNLLHSLTVTGPVANMVADPFGNIWMYVNTGVFMKYDSSGNLLSPAAGYPATSGAVYPSGYQITFDSAGNLWTASITGNTARPCFQKFTNAGVPAFAPVCFTTSINATAIATDSAGNAYMSSNGPTVLFKVDALGNVVTTPPFTATGLPLSSGANQLHFDPVTNHLVLLQANAFSALNPNGTQALASVSSTVAVQAPTFFTLDGAGDFWYGNTAGSPYFSVAEISPTGAFLTPTNGFPTSGLIPPGINNPKGIGVDSYGNVWVVSYPIGNNAVQGFLQKIPGVAVPKTQQSY